MLKERNIGEADLDLFSVTDDPKKAVKIVTDFYAKVAHAPNF